MFDYTINYRTKFKNSVYLWVVGKGWKIYSLSNRKALKKRNIIIGSNVKFGVFVTIDDYTTIGSNTVIGNYVEIGENVSIGQGVILPSHTVVKSNSTIEKQEDISIPTEEQDSSSNEREHLFYYDKRKKYWVHAPQEFKKIVSPSLAVGDIETVAFQVVKIDKREINSLKRFTLQEVTMDWKERYKECKKIT